MNWRRFIFYANVVTITLLLCFLAMAFLWSEYLSFFCMSQQTCLLAIMHLISLLFLLAFFQTPISLPWKIFCIFASFFIVMEATLMIGIWR